MKKFITLFFVLFSGCDGDGYIPLFKVEVGKSDSSVVYSDDSWVRGDIKVIKIDSCEYIRTFVNNGQIVMHKNDCRYCAVVRERERSEELKMLVELLDSRYVLK